ncbi:hypothetical protein, partial [Mesorhizobium sp.]
NRERRSAKTSSQAFFSLCFRWIGKNAFSGLCSPKPFTGESLARSVLKYRSSCRAFGLDFDRD